MTAINAVNGEKLSRVSGPRCFGQSENLASQKRFIILLLVLLFCAYTDRNVESGVWAMDYVIDSVIITFVNYFNLKFRSHCLL